MKAGGASAGLEAPASTLSRLYWTWLGPLLTLASSQPLSPADLPALPDGDDAAAVTATFVEAWNAEVARAAASGPGVAPSAWRAIGAAYGADYLRAALPLKPLWLGFVLLQSFAVRGLVQFAASADVAATPEYTLRAAVHWVGVASAPPPLSSPGGRAHAP
jgi:hypothetical protein